MAKIQVLTEQLINQIAAGEVVERPASVVKELLENSIDAEATEIAVEVKESGQTLIRVTDNGVGMDKTDALKCLERHATSKINSVDDLFAIKSMGFRGEALASIASVSQLTVRTKQKGELSGTEIETEGGTIKNIQEKGLKEGTQIEVKELFFNTPARKKYLKNNHTEYQHILDIVTSLALAFPQIGFKLIHNEKLIFDLPATSSDIVRIRSVLGKNIADELIPVFYGGVHLGLSGFIGKPLLARSSKSLQYLFVNQRLVKSHVLSYAVKDAYHTLLPREKYPVFILKFDLQPSLVDVNVHPRKTEVKFVDEREIFRVLTMATEKALENHVLAPKINSDGPINYYQERKVQDFTATSQTVTSAAHASAQKTENDHYKLEHASLQQVKAALQFTKDLAADTTSAPLNTNASSLDVSTEATLSEKISTEEKNSENISIAETLPEEVSRDLSAIEIKETETIYNLAAHDKSLKPQLLFEERTEEAPLIPLGQLDRSFILCSQNNSLVIVDQHAAHERIRYTELMAQESMQEKQIQPLLTPLHIEVNPQDKAILDGNKEFLEHLGFELSYFGGNSFIIEAVPSFLYKEDLDETFLGLIDDLRAEKQQGNFQSRREKIITYLACRSAVKFGDALSMEEQISLVKKLQTLALPYTCPHGRPTMIIMTKEELWQRFGRKYC